MKINFAYFFALVIIGLFNACDDGDETTTNNESFYLLGTWSGIDQYGDITYVITESNFNFSRNSPEMAGTGDIVLKNTDNKYVIVKITSHDITEQVGKYARVLYTTESSLQTNITFYDLCDTQAAAEVATTILVDNHTVIKQ